MCCIVTKKKARRKNRTKRHKLNTLIKTMWIWNGLHANMRIDYYKERVCVCAIVSECEYLRRLLYRPVVCTILGWLWVVDNGVSTDSIGIAMQFTCYTSTLRAKSEKNTLHKNDANISVIRYNRREIPRIMLFCCASAAFPYLWACNLF